MAVRKLPNGETYEVTREGTLLERQSARRVPTYDEYNSPLINQGSDVHYVHLTRIDGHEIDLDTISISDIGAALNEFASYDGWDNADFSEGF